LDPRFRAGRHPSKHGEFAVELACTTAELAVFPVILWSVEPFFEVGSEEDHERAAFHEAVLAKDLCGQREFSWGEVFSEYHPRDARNCLNVVCTPGPKVPRVPRLGLGWPGERLAP
jgi:hypothetical protein